MADSFELRQIKSSDRDEVSRLIFHSTNAWYTQRGFPAIFQGEETSPSAFFDLYAQLDGDAGLVVTEAATGKIVGSCFVHPRETHYSLGIMNVHAEYVGKGIARRLLTEIIQRATSEKKPVRLVSSCFNLDSYSLYTRAGFAPIATYQDMLVSVPEGGLGAATQGRLVRTATLEDVPAMRDLELEISRISRVNDYRHFITNPDGLWHVSVVDGAEQGELDGFLVSGSSPVCNMIGPGVMRDEEVAIGLFHAELDLHRGRMPLCLIPVGAKSLVRAMYDWGGRNCEMHVAQVYGEGRAPNGIAIPTFLPESG